MGSAVEDVAGRRWAHGDNLERSNSVEGKLGLGHRGVGVGLCTLVG